MESFNEVYLRSMEYEPNDVNQLYFSSENIDLLQKMIQQQIYIDSNKRHKISRQSDDELLIIMRSVYMEHSRNLPGYVKEQIIELNQHVVSECVRIILPRIEQHVSYMNTLDKRLDIMDYGETTTTKGTKTTQLFRSI